MTNVILYGCNGRMGQMIAGLCGDDPEINIVAGIDTYAEKKNDFPVFPRIGECNVTGDVVIDFSNAGAVDALLEWCVEKSVPVVLCSTGFSQEQLEKVEAASKKIAVLKSAFVHLDCLGHIFLYAPAFLVHTAEIAVSLPVFIFRRDVVPL